MNTVAWIGAVLAGWVVLSVVTGLLFGQVIRRRDAQTSLGAAGNRPAATSVRDLNSTVVRNLHGSRPQRATMPARRLGNDPIAG